MSPSRILIAMPTWVGDAALATPLIEAIHEHLPAVPMDFVIKPYLRGLLNDAPWLGRVFEWSPRGGFWSLRTELARRRYSWGIMLPNSLRPALLMALARVGRRVGYARNGRAPLLTDRLPFPDTKGRTVPFRMVDFYGRLGEALAVPRCVRPLRLYVRDELVERSDRLLGDRGVTAEGPVVGLNPGAKYGSSKLWPVAHFAETADALIERFGAQVVVLAGPGEDGLAGELCCAITRGAVVLPSSAVDLEMLKAVIRRLDLLITNDTGPRHVAAAFGVPTVAIFGPTHTTWGDSGFERSAEIAIDVDCGPCMQRTCPLGHHRCMTDLPPRRVIEAATALLEGCRV